MPILWCPLMKLRMEKVDILIWTLSYTDHKNITYKKITMEDSAFLALAVGIIWPYY